MSDHGSARRRDHEDGLPTEPTGERAANLPDALGPRDHPRSHPEAHTDTANAANTASTASVAEDTDRHQHFPTDFAPDFTADFSLDDSADPEETLRRLLRDTVRPIQPSPQSLHMLRLGVTVRRRRRRQMLFGTAASVVLLGVGMPLMVHTAATVGGGSGGGSSAVGTAEPGSLGENGSGEGPNGLGDTSTWDAVGGPSHDPVADGSGSAGLPSGNDGTTDGAVPDPTNTSDLESYGMSVVACSRAQLGGAEAIMGQPDDAGQIYGAFRLTNISGEPCRVEDTGELAVLPVSDSSDTNVQILDRTAGDRATGLPDESLEELVLKPGDAYEVQFAFIPQVGTTDGGCVRSDPTDPPTDGTTPPVGDPNASTGPSTNAASDSGQAGEGGTGEPMPETGGTASGAGGTSDGGTGDTSNGNSNGSSSGNSGDGGGDPGGGDAGGSGGETDQGVLLRYTPAAGEPEAAHIELAGACVGTVYRTGVLRSVTQ